MEFIYWQQGNEYMAEKDAIDATMKAEAELATVRHVESWNRDLAIYKARQWLCGRGTKEPARPVAASSSARAGVKAAERLDTGSPTSSRKRRLDAATIPRYLTYQGHLYPVVQAMHGLTSDLMALFKDEPETGGRWLVVRPHRLNKNRRQRMDREQRTFDVSATDFFLFIPAEGRRASMLCKVSGPAGHCVLLAETTSRSQVCWPAIPQIWKHK